MLKHTNSLISFFCFLTNALCLLSSPANAETSVDRLLTELDESSKSQFTKVSELADVKPTDWAASALQSLVERYGCITGYPDASFRGNRTMNRYEFAAGLNACLNRISEQIATTDSLTKDDLAKVQKLQQDFAAELATLGSRVDVLEARTAAIESNQFSTTTKLGGQVIMSVNTGGFDGDRIVDANNRQLASSDPNTTLFYRAGLDFDTSFSGTDQLKIRLETGSGGATDNAASLLEPNFGSSIDYSREPPTNGELGIGRLSYTFKPDKDLTIALGPDIRATDYVDRNSYANLSFLDFSTQAFVNNYVLFPVDGPSAGAAIDWKPNGGAFSLRASYAAADAANPTDNGFIVGTAPFIQVLYPGPGSGARGLFGDTHQGTVELEYAPSRSFALRLQYSGGEVFNNQFDAIGANIEYSVTEKVGIFGRYGSGGYDETVFGDVKPNYWMAGVAARDLFVEGALAGIAVGQPFITDDIGDATQTNFEAFYNYPFSRNIQLTPSIQLIENASNQDSNGTIVVGTLRTVFSF
ncbi:MAG: iron uptake porin [Xenococcaceae cyanobacterium]